MNGKMAVRIWGVRGSLPSPGAATVRYGGNTSCIELRYGEENYLVIIDAGTGIKVLGDELVKTDLKNGPIRATILLTHTHWDHIMGFPFFAPIYIPGTILDVYGPVTYEEDTLSEVIGGQLTYRYFPVRQSELAATIRYHELREQRLNLPGGMVVITKYLNHPILTLGYRFEYQGKVFCTVYDTEPFRNLFPTDPNDPKYDETAAIEGNAAVHDETDKMTQFMMNADLVMYDSQYTDEEYWASKTGWGHSTFEYALEAARLATIKKLVFFHHDPLRSDDELDRLYELYAGAAAGCLRTELATGREGMTIVV